MFGAIAPVLGTLAPGLLRCLVGRNECAADPSVIVLLFHEAVAAGRVEEIGNFFSFASAYQYWQDVTASLGVACPERDEFAVMLGERFRDDRVRHEAASFTPACFRWRVVGPAASVVFRKKGAPPGDDAGVASAVLENGLWKVRTYPGIFPGRLLCELRRSAVEQARKDAGEYEAQ